MNNSLSAKFTQCEFFQVPKIALCEDPVYIYFFLRYITNAMSRKMKIEWKKKSDKSSRKLSIFQNCLRKGEKYSVTKKTCLVN